MDERVHAALTQGGVIDITTTGRRTGEPRRIEIVFHAFDGRVYISGFPRPKKRSWLANLEAQPRFTFHLKGEVAADLAAVARPIAAEPERREVLAKVARVWDWTDIEEAVKMSPLVEVTFEGA